MRDKGKACVLNRWRPEIDPAFAVNARRKEETLLQATTAIIRELWQVESRDSAAAT